MESSAWRTATPTAGLGRARGFGGTGSEDALDATVDPFGNTYVVGEFTGTVDFDPGPGIVGLTSGGSNDACVVRLDATGNLVWARSFGGMSVDLGEEVAVDTNGNVDVAGLFEGAADLDPGPGTFTLTSAGTADAFRVKLDRVGLFVWAASFGEPSPDLDRAGGLAVDRGGNVYLAGSFYGTADFDPGAGVVNLTSTGGADAFVVRLDSGGHLTWARSFGGTNGEDLAGAAVDRAGSVYLTGGFFGTVDFDPGSGVFSLTSAGNADAFAIKLDSAGNFTWAGSFGGLGPDAASNIAADSSGNMYVAGIFRGTADFDPGPGTTNTSNTGDADAYVVKLGAAGTINWARSPGGSQTDIADDVAVDNNGNLYVGGSFEGTADFDPGPGTFALTSAGSIDAFEDLTAPVTSPGQRHLVGRDLTQRGLWRWAVAGTCT